MSFPLAQLGVRPVQPPPFGGAAQGIAYGLGPSIAVSRPPFASSPLPSGLVDGSVLLPPARPSPVFASAGIAGLAGGDEVTFLRSLESRVAYLRSLVDQLSDLRPMSYAPGPVQRWDAANEQFAAAVAETQDQIGDFYGQDWDNANRQALNAQMREISKAAQKVVLDRAPESLAMLASLADPRFILPMIQRAAAGAVVARRAVATGAAAVGGAVSGFLGLGWLSWIVPVALGVLLIGIYVADLPGDLIAGADTSRVTDYIGLGVKVFVY